MPPASFCKKQFRTGPNEADRYVGRDAVFLKAWSLQPS